MDVAFGGCGRGKKQAPPLAKSPGKPPARARVVQSTTQTRAVKAPTPPKPQPATQVKPEKPAKVSYPARPTPYVTLTAPALATL